MLVWAIIQFAAQVAWVIPSRVRATVAGPSGLYSAAGAAGLERDVLIGVAVGLLLVSLVLPVCFLAFWTRPSVRAAFAQQSRRGRALAPTARKRVEQIVRD